MDDAQTDTKTNAETETPLSRLRNVTAHMRLAYEMAKVEMQLAHGKRIVLAIGYENADESGKVVARLDMGPFMDDLEAVLGAAERAVHGPPTMDLEEVYELVNKGKIDEMTDHVVNKIFEMGERAEWDTINSILSSIDVERAGPDALASFLTVTIPMRGKVSARKKLLEASKVVFARTETPEEYQKLMSVLDNKSMDSQ